MSDYNNEKEFKLKIKSGAFTDPDEQRKQQGIMIGLISGFSMILILVITLGVILKIRYNINTSSVIVKQIIGSSHLIRNKSKAKITKYYKLAENDKISTDYKSTMVFRIKKDALVFVGDKSEYEINAIPSEKNSNNTIKMNIKRGLFYFNLINPDSNTQLEVHTGSAAITSSNAIFYLFRNKNEDKTEIFIIKGKAVITGDHGYNTIHEGRKIIIVKNRYYTNSIVTGEYEVAQVITDYLLNANTTEAKKGQLLSTTSYEVFSKRPVESGLLMMTPFFEAGTIDSIEPVAVNLTHNNPVMGIIPFSRGCVLFTSDSLIILDKSGELQTKINLPEKISSYPYIKEERLYVSLTDSRLAVYSMISGESVAMLSAPGFITHYNRITEIDYGLGPGLVLPFTDGLYLYKDETITKFITLKNPGTPVVMDNTIFVNSLKSPDIMMYTMEGNLKKRIVLDNPSEGTLSIYDDSLVIGDSQGIVYHIAPDGKITHKIPTVTAAINSPIYSRDKSMVFINRWGILMHMTEKTLDPFSELITVNKNRDKSFTRTRTFTALANYFVIGNDLGELFFIDPTNGDYGELRKISLPEIKKISALHWTGEALILGTKSGNILKIKK